MNDCKAQGPWLKMPARWAWEASPTLTKLDRNPVIWQYGAPKLSRSLLAYFPFVEAQEAWVRSCVSPSSQAFCARYLMSADILTPLILIRRTWHHTTRILSTSREGANHNSIHYTHPWYRVAPSASRGEIWSIASCEPGIDGTRNAHFFEPNRLSILGLGEAKSEERPARRQPPCVSQTGRTRTFWRSVAHPDITEIHSQCTPLLSRKSRF
jgi:hypothetical protein